MNVEEHVLENTIHAITAGSRLYGTARPDSDYDLRGVCLMPPQALVGLARFEQWQPNTPLFSSGKLHDDVCIYGLNKFVELALGANPNILDILFAPPVTWNGDLQCNKFGLEPWRTIYSERSRFLSQKVRHTYAGYAFSQLKRIKGHRKWIENPPTHKPTVEEYNGKVWSLAGGAQHNYFKGLDDQKRYEAAARTWKQYQTWLRERNPARAELERKHGYDTKHASHLVRLLLQGARILATGDFCPTLTGQDLDIVQRTLAGEHRYTGLVSWSETFLESIKLMDSKLPKTPDRKYVEAILMSINRGSLAGLVVNYEGNHWFHE